MFMANQKAFQKKHDFPIALDVPAPIIKVVSIERADSDIPGSCSAYAGVAIEVSLPDGSIFSMEDLGFVFRSPSDKPQDRFVAFPNFPITSMKMSDDGRIAYFFFMLIDRVEQRGKPFQLTLDVFAINRYLQVGPSTQVVLAAP